jgi:hypothetical protein
MPEIQAIVLMSYSTNSAMDGAMPDAFNAAITYI